MNVLDETYFKFSGRIYKKNNHAFLGYTNSSVTFYVKSTSTPANVHLVLSTKDNGEVNEARLRVYVDDVENDSLLILNKEVQTLPLIQLEDTLIHKITIVKITEAAMSYACIEDILLKNTMLIPLPETEDKRLKVEFIGDSITCGYGVLGQPESEYHIREEDGEKTYAYFLSKDLDLNARYLCVSGYGVYLSYDAILENVLPNVYPYTNFFLSKDQLIDPTEFVPDLIVINLGTNDSGHFEKEGVKEEFLHAYQEFLLQLKEFYPSVKILCICGTLCQNVFPYINEAVTTLTKEGISDLYSFELPYHDVASDSMASFHPSIQTHKKDAIRLSSIIKGLFKEYYPMT